MGFFDRSAEAIRAGLRERVFEPRALREAQRRRPTVAPPGPSEAGVLGDAERGAAMVAGAFEFDGWTVTAKPGALWRAKAPSPTWAEAAHGFVWLADLDALGTRDAQATAGLLLDGWIERHRRYDALAWRADLSAERLWRWLDSDLFHGARASDKRLASASAHVLWLEKHWPETPSGMAAIRVASALCRACLQLDGLEAHRPASIERLEQALAGGLDRDGVPLTRSPEDALEVFERLQLLREAFAAETDGGEAAAFDEPGADLAASPETVADAMPALARALRFFRRADGGLPLFHGGRAAAEGRLDAALTRARLRDAAAETLQSAGYLRFSGARVSAMFDVGGAARGAEVGEGLETRPETRLATPLAIEMVSGRRRLVVNCGSGAHLDEEWARAARSLAGHSTIGLDATAPERAAFAPKDVTSDRRSERNGEWLFGAHDGFAETHGALVSRRMFLTADGGDFRGEDVVELAANGEKVLERRLAKLPRQSRSGGVAFRVRFHLHPDVEPELVADGEAVALRLPHGENWVMRQAGGRISLAPSFYLDRASRPRSSAQIVVVGAFEGEKTHVRWAFRRVGELSQQPRDVEALLASVEPESRMIDGALDDAAGRGGGAGRTGGVGASPLMGLGRPPFSG